MGGHTLKTNSTAKAIINIRGPEVTYGQLKLTPNLESSSHSIDVNSFTIRSGDDRFSLSDFPLARALNRNARNDIIYHTFEADEDERQEFLEIEFEIPGYDEIAKLRFRAAERYNIDDMLFFDVEDIAGDWIGLEDLLFPELIPDSFMRVLETSVMEALTEHHLDMLPMYAES